MVSRKKRLAIIGGGAAGLMAAATLLEYQKDVDIHLFEKNNKLGAKVIISGGGRCNVTTGVRDPHKLLKHYTRGADFLKAALSKFTPEMVYNWFEDNGVPLKMESDLRAFPQSDDGKDIVGVFEKMFSQKGVHVHYGEPVRTISKNNNEFLLTSDNNTYTFDTLVITTGGNAYRQTGSTGDGYAFAQDLGHSITTLGPSLNSFVTEQKWVHSLSGLSFVNAQLSYNKIKVHGPFLFTHFGISGPVTFSLSSHTPFIPITKDTPLDILFKPDALKHFILWDNEIQKSIADNPRKQFKTILELLFPNRFVHALFALTNLPENIKASEISKKQRQYIARLLGDGIKLTLTKRRPGDEFVTAGGVSTNEINKQTMESLICPGLYFAGEIIDVDGVTGGFNLQSSWATGRLAGKALSKHL